VSRQSSTPTYNLSAVIRETGVKPDTLRAWERRYGLPRPDRSPGGHRLYSARDVETVKWLLARRKEGMTISRAVALWQELESKGEDPLSYLHLPPRMTPTVHPAQPALEALRHSWLQACRAFDEARSQALLDQAFALASPELACLEVLQRGLAEAGALWYQGQLSAHAEHFITAQAVRRVEALRNAAPSPTRAGAILVCCPAGEHHTFSALLIDFLLRRRGYAVLYLGADTPPGGLDAAIENLDVVLTVASAQTLPAAAGLPALAQALSHRHIPMAFGGWIFNRIPSLQNHVGGHFLGPELPQAIDALEAHLADGKGLHPASGQAEAQTRTAPQLLESLPSIHAQLLQCADLRAIPHSLLEQCLQILSEGILAALSLDALQAVEALVEWVGGFLDHRGFSQFQIQRFHQMYFSALASEMARQDLHLWQKVRDHLPALGQRQTDSPSRPGLPDTTRR
jgi:DNA-binding transcriptional MerR regulator/methylmalonyl-CoA mutase cobalamin-binding subunit